jgi:hypothetical protein
LNIKRTGAQIFALVLIGVVAAYLTLTPEDGAKQTETSSAAPQAVPDGRLSPQQPAAPQSGIQPPDSSAPEVPPEIPDIEYNPPQPVLGQKLYFREIRLADDDGEDNPVRDIQFEIRQGVLPKRLFDNTHQLIVHYDQLQKNEVGMGAVTTRFYFEVVTADSDGDGRLSPLDKREVGVSFADGSDYTRLASGIDKVIAYDYSPVDNSLHLSLLINNQPVSRIYSLENYQVIAND